MKSLLFLLVVLACGTNGVIVNSHKSTWANNACDSGCLIEGGQNFLRSGNYKFSSLRVQWPALASFATPASAVSSAHIKFTIGCFAAGENCAGINARGTCEGNNHTVYIIPDTWTEATLSGSNCPGLSCNNVPSATGTVGTGTVSGGILSVNAKDAVNANLNGVLSVIAYESDTATYLYMSHFCSDSGTNPPYLQYS